MSILYTDFVPKMFTFKIKVSLKILFSAPNKITANDTYVTDANGKIINVLRYYAKSAEKN